MPRLGFAFGSLAAVSFMAALWSPAVLAQSAPADIPAVMSVCTPVVGEEYDGNKDRWGQCIAAVGDYLKGIDVNGRLGVLYSNKDYGCEWDYDWRNKRFLAEDNTKFAVNVVVYAMTN